jgi:hypothetical protein
MKSVAADWPSLYSFQCKVPSKKRQVVNVMDFTFTVNLVFI